MPYILAKTNKSRVYHKGSRYLVSQVSEERLRRVVVDEAEAISLVQAPDAYWDELIEDLITEHRNEGSAEYFEVKI